ncbi:hypothetical protein [Enterovibrio norvegicus]|uniref:Uncharacterized protein n=1 Tax=Enterovibrio norvegicus TaxID=188144 RepID=A0ABV4L4I1_9GAMM|nr:hypothetical protein [Enterovibrio norvegicus]
MTMLKTLMLALAVFFTGSALATSTDGGTKCPEGSEAPECQVKDDNSGS